MKKISNEDLQVIVEWSRTINARIEKLEQAINGRTRDGSGMSQPESSGCGPERAAVTANVNPTTLPPRPGGRRD